MTELKISGVIEKILTPENGTTKQGKDWKKQQFVISTGGEYPKSICLMLWNDKIDLLKEYSVGDKIDVSINIESREFNDRWYTDIMCWKIEGEPSKNVPAPNNESNPPEEIKGNPDDQDLPFIITALLGVGSMITMVI